MSTDQIQLIHDEVRTHYAERIQRGSCCAPTASTTEISLYGEQTIAALPEGVVTTSFGCGNPLAIASLQPGEVVLDLGSGGGLDVLLAAQRVGAQGFVYGLDMTDEMLAVARRNAEKAGAQNVAFLKGQIEQIPLPDQQIDVIISNCVINLSPDKGQTLADAFRVLKSGGRLAVSDIAVDGTLDDLPVSEQQIRAALSWAGCIAGALTINDYRQLLEQAGFERIQFEINQRYSTAALIGEPSEELAFMSAELAEQVVQRFVSCSITAFRP